MQEEGTRDKTAKLLLRHGADVNATDDFGRTALSYVCEKRCNDILRILIKEHNVDPDIADVNGKRKYQIDQFIFCLFIVAIGCLHGRSPHTVVRYGAENETRSKIRCKT